MGDALVELGPPQGHQAVDEGLGSRRADHPLGPVAALVPARHHKLEEIDQVVAVQVGQQQGVDVAARKPGGEQPLGHPRSAIDKQRPATMADHLGGAVTFAMDNRTAGAE